MRPHVQNRQLSACEGKAAFHSLTRAKTQAKRMRRRHDRAFVAYRCDFCRAWHVGSKESWQDGGVKQ